MTFVQQSRCVRKNESSQHCKELAEESGQECDKVHHVILNLPTENFRVAESLGIQSSFSIARKSKDSKHQLPDKRTQRSSFYDVFEDPLPVTPFNELPHPRELFGKGRDAERSEGPRHWCCTASQDGTDLGGVIPNKDQSQFVALHTHKYSEE